jgi:hypothetical protein
MSSTAMIADDAGELQADHRPNFPAIPFRKVGFVQPGHLQRDVAGQVKRRYTAWRKLTANVMPSESTA